MMFKIAALALVGLAMVAAGGARAANPVVVIETSMGTIKAELYEDKAPISVKNFLAYAEAKHYDGTVFHRVINDFMIQGGGFEPGMKQKKANAPIKNESSNGLKNEKYTLAMARTPDPDSATSQFFINVKDNDFLNKERSRDGAGYCVFGKVTEGGDVIEKMKVVPTGEKGGHGDVPTTDIVIKSVKVEKKG